MILVKSLLTESKLTIFTSIFLSVICFTSSVSAIPQVAVIPMPETNSPPSETPNSTMRPSSNSNRRNSEKNEKTSKFPSATSPSPPPSIPIIPATSSEVNNSQSIDTSTASNSSKAQNFITATDKPVPSVNDNMSLSSSNGTNETNIQAEILTSPSPNKALNFLMSQNNNNQTGSSCNGACMFNNNKSVPANNTSGSKSNVTVQSTIPSSTLPPQFAVTPLPVRVRKMPDGNENE